MCGFFSITRGCLQYKDFVTFSVTPADISLLLHLDATGMHSIRTVCNASLLVSCSCLSNKFLFFKIMIIRVIASGCQKSFILHP